MPKDAAYYREYRLRRKKGRLPATAKSYAKPAPELYTIDQAEYFRQYNRWWRQNGYVRDRAHEWWK